MNMISIVKMSLSLTITVCCVMAIKNNKKIIKIAENRVRQTLSETSTEGILKVMGGKKMSKHTRKLFIDELNKRGVSI